MYVKTSHQQELESYNQNFDFGFAHFNPTPWSRVLMKSLRCLLILCKLVYVTV